MPNHITNIIKASDKVLNYLKGADSDVDFNSVFKMPKSLEIAVSSTSKSAYYILFGGEDSFLGLDTELGRFRDRDFKDQKSSVEEALKARENLLKHGHTDWYEWSCARWGTKWNAYNISSVDGGVHFETAWSPPRPIIETLSNKFPEEEIEHLYADEDIGSNLGHSIWLVGVEIQKEIHDPIDFALTVTGRDDREGYILNKETGKWEYCEEEE